MHTNLNRSKSREAKYITAHLKYFLLPIFVTLQIVFLWQLSKQLKSSKAVLHGI